ncbi:hypothetical protein NQ318_019667 [Aromia moschata]|uniref:Uncharacterized protein n=1 Tax=Aromia moschata TaxID=1265417 RepID=A0AAV8Z5A4_9CUCU|nr:hypothetical protein NQ318_019667 [Aromia moschata]
MVEAPGYWENWHRRIRHFQEVGPGASAKNGGGAGILGESEPAHPPFLRSWSRCIRQEWWRRWDTGRIGTGASAIFENLVPAHPPKMVEAPGYWETWNRHLKNRTEYSVSEDPYSAPSAAPQFRTAKYRTETSVIGQSLASEPRAFLSACRRREGDFENDTMRIVWAFYKEEPVGGAVGPKSLPQHDAGSHGTQSLYLVQRADQDGPGPEETARVWELRNPAVDPPPPGDTLYWCRVFRIPTITRKHHLIRKKIPYEHSEPHCHGTAYSAESLI